MSARSGIAIIYEGEQRPIVDRGVFERAQALLASQAPARRSTANTGGQHLLSGFLVDETGDKLCSVHANKSGRRYRYYVSKQLVEERGTSGWRLPAEEIEAVVEQQLNRLTRDRARLADWIRQCEESDEMSKALGGCNRVDQF